MLSDQGREGRISSSMTFSRFDQSGFCVGSTLPLKAPPGMGPSGPSNNQPPKVSSAATIAIAATNIPTTQRRIRIVTAFGAPTRPEARRSVEPAQLLPDLRGRRVHGGTVGLSERAGGVGVRRLADAEQGEAA